MDKPTVMMPIRMPFYKSFPSPMCTFALPTKRNAPSAVRADINRLCHGIHHARCNLLLEIQAQEAGYQATSQ